MNKTRLAAPFVFTALLSVGGAQAGTAKKLPKPTHPERVHKGEDGRCMEYGSTECPPGVHCNPGPPHEVECPSEPSTKK